MGLAYRRHLIYTFMSMHPQGESCALRIPLEVPAALGGWATAEPGWTLLRAPTIPGTLSRQASPSPHRPSRRSRALGKDPPPSWASAKPGTPAPTQQQLEWLPWGPNPSGWSRGGEQSACQQKWGTGPRSLEMRTATLREQTCFLAVSLWAIGALHFSQITRAAKLL